MSRTPDSCFFYRRYLVLVALYLYAVTYFPRRPSDAIRSRSAVKVNEGVAYVYLFSASLVLDTRVVDSLSCGGLALPASTNHYRQRLVREDRWIHIVSPGAPLESKVVTLGSWKTSVWQRTWTGN